jgi:hypothetical protein
VAAPFPRLVRFEAEMSEQAIGTLFVKLVNRLTLKGSLLFTVTLALLVSGCSRKPSDRYTYLKEGEAQFRVDNEAGRTDKLEGANGWQPVSFDRPPENLPTEQAQKLFPTAGKWERSGFNDKICFHVLNDSDYVVESVRVLVSINPKPADADDLGDAVIMKAYLGGLLARGRQDLFCGDAPRPLPGTANWTFGDLRARGWKE